MNPIKSFNKQLNASYDPNSLYVEWTKHRTEVSHILNKIALKDKKVLVIGVGNANDLDLNLFDECQKTVLLDIDLESVHSGIQRQETAYPFDLLSCDLTGLENSSFIHDFLESIESQTESTVIERYNNIYTPLNMGRFDVIIVLPIYTQLLLPQLLPYMKTPESVSSLLTFIAYRIQRLNDQLRRALNPQGTLCIFSDVLEYEKTSEEANYLIAHQDHKVILAQHFQDYLTSFGHGLGSYGLEEMNGELKAYYDDYLIWPFDEKRILLVKVQLHKQRQS